MAYNYYDSPEYSRRYYTPTPSSPSRPVQQQPAQPTGWQNDPAPGWLRILGTGADKLTNLAQTFVPGLETARKGLTISEQQSALERAKNLGMGIPMTAATVGTGAITKLPVIANLGWKKLTAGAIATGIAATAAENKYGGKVTGPTTVDGNYGSYVGTKIPSMQVSQLADFIKINPEQGALAAQKMYRDGLISKAVFDRAVQASIDAVNSRLATSQAAEAAQKQRDSEFMKAVQQLGGAQYGAAVGQANSQYNIGKQEATNELTKLLTLLGQREAGAGADLGLGMAQSGFSTSPGLYDTSLDVLSEQRVLGEQQGREGFAKTLAQLGQQRAAASAAAAAARRAEQLQAIAEYTRAKYPGTV